MILDYTIKVVFKSRKQANTSENNEINRFNTVEKYSQLNMKNQ